MPPLTFTVAFPFVPPLQATVVVDSKLTFIPVVEGTIVVPILVHPFASVTVMEYAPALKLVAIGFVSPEGVHKYVNAPIPPLAITVAPPPPWQVADVKVTVVVIAEGCIITTVSG